MLKTNRLVQGAMIAALFGVLSFFNTYTASFFDAFIGYIMVVPFAWYGYRYSIRDNIAVSLASIAIVFMTGLPTFILIAVITCMMGVYIGECLKRQASQLVMLAGTTIIAFIDLILVYEVFAGLFGVDLVAEMTETYKMLASAGLGTAITLQNFLDFIPMMIMLMSLMEAYVVLILCQGLLRRFKVPFNNDFHILNFMIPLKYGYILLAILLGCYGMMRFGQFDLTIIRYIYVFVMMIFMVDGMAAAATWLIVNGHPRLSGFVFFACFIPPLLIAIELIGIFDTITQWRKDLLQHRES
ncbi:MAG: DUF2232 domain-containing protein [Erysipelotrichaceae bacterium]|nr:DUF2232 domain-containing protein [Erysipelotrichaceae bacterium]